MLAELRSILFNPTVICVRHVRIWKRKPLTAPTAKSKLFRVPKKPNLPEDEVREMRRLHNIYSTTMKSLYQYFFEQMMKQAASSETSQLRLREEEEEHRRLMEVNRLENEKTAKWREERRAKEREELQAKVLNSLLKREKEEELLKEKISQFIKEQKALAPTFITRENLERAIDEALSNPQDFNFAIDLQGNLYREVETKANPTKQETSIA